MILQSLLEPGLTHETKLLMKWIEIGCPGGGERGGGGPEVGICPGALTSQLKGVVYGKGEAGGGEGRGKGVELIQNRHSPNSAFCILTPPPPPPSPT
jgi:hypothetical protein